MKFDIVINFDREKQEDVEAKPDIPESKVREIVDKFFCEKSFADRRKWLIENVNEMVINMATAKMTSPHPHLDLAFAQD